MVKFILMCSLLVSAFTTQAKEVFITGDEGTAWYIYTDTYSTVDGGYSFMVLSRDLTNPQKSARAYIGVPFDDCTNGSGTMFIRENKLDEWDVVSPFRRVDGTIENHTVADIIASSICGVGEYQNKQKLNPKKKVKG